MLLFTGVALAQVSNPDIPRINAQRFRPTIDGRFTLWTDDAARAQDWRPAFRVLAHDAFEPLLYTFESGASTAVVKHLVQTDLIASIGYQRFRVGAVVPLALATSNIEPTEVGIGDLAFDGKAVVLDGENAPVRVAVQGRLGLPTASLANALGARKITWEVSGILDRKFGKGQVALNVGMRGGPNIQLENVRIDDYAVIRAGGGIQIVRWLGAGGEIVADVPLHSDAADALAAEWMANVRANPTRDLQVRVGFGTGLTNGVATPDWRLLAGIVFQGEGPRDSDDDGVVNGIDACRDEPEDMDGEHDEDGCPEDIGTMVVQVFDRHGDALLDAQVKAGVLTGTGALQGEIDAGTVVVEASAPGHLPASVEVALTDADVDKLVVLELQPEPTPMSIEVRGPSGPIEGSVTLDGKPVPEALPPGRVELVATAEGFRSQTRVVEVTEVPATVVFELRPDRLPLLLAEDGTEASVPVKGTRPQDRAVLDAAAAAIGSLPEGSVVRLVGFVVADEPAERGLARAEAVQKALVERGVDAARLRAEDGGATDGEARVELLVAE